MNITDDELYEAFKAYRTNAKELTGVFMGVKTTGIFCRPGCPARFPLRQNCVFFLDVSAALVAGFRACKRCHPLRLPGEATGLVKQLIAGVEEDLTHVWTEVDLTQRGIDPSTARRQFKARFGLTFTQYARGRRLAKAAEQLGKGESVINTQLDAGYESASGFRSAFAKTFGVAPKNANGEPLRVEWIDTPLGPMVTVASDSALYLLEFTDRKMIDRQFRKLSKLQKRAILPGSTPMTEQVKRELSAYFAGELKDFTLKLETSGTVFQKETWAQLCAIPYGETRSYAELAVAVGNDKAVRAVAGSNAANGLAIIIPCHRVIRTGGDLGGYAGNLSRKRWLLAHEAKFTALTTQI